LYYFGQGAFLESYYAAYAQFQSQAYNFLRLLQAAAETVKDTCQLAVLLLPYYVYTVLRRLAAVYDDGQIVLQGHIYLRGKGFFLLFYMGQVPVFIQAYFVYGSKFPFGQPFGYYA